jgi:hypothetical protein
VHPPIQGNFVYKYVRTKNLISTIL